MSDDTQRDALAWALAGWAEADRCAEASAALAAEFAEELAGRRDRSLAALDEHILLREALRQAEIARDLARAERDLAREALLGAHEIIRDYRAAAGCDTPDVEDVGEGEG